MKESRKEYRDAVARRSSMVYAVAAEMRRAAKVVVGDSTSWEVLSASEVMESLRSPFPIRHAVRGR